LSQTSPGKAGGYAPFPKGYVGLAELEGVRGKRKEPTIYSVIASARRFIPSMVEGSNLDVAFFLFGGKVFYPDEQHCCEEWTLLLRSAQDEAH
jgi:hypothetical protein